MAFYCEDTDFGSILINYILKLNACNAILR